jgi:hypothetical protein
MAVGKAGWTYSSPEKYAEPEEKLGSQQLKNRQSIPEFRRGLTEPS